MPDAAKIIKDWCASCGMPEPSDGECHALAVAISAAAPVVLPEPDAAIKEVMGLVDVLQFENVGIIKAVTPYELNTAHRNAQKARAAIESKLRALLATATAATEPFGYFKAEPFGWTDCGPDDEGAVALYEKPQAMLATGGQAQAVERGEVLVTVSGFTGSGKSAIAGEIEILCRALGLQVEWPDGDSEKNMTHADWTAALEQYKPRVHIVEQNIPFAAMKGMSK